jgi:hypothetical protein
VSSYSILPLSFHAPIFFSLRLQGKPFVVLFGRQFSVVRYVPVKRFGVYPVFF